MITPGLWRRALARAAQWRLLLLYVAVLALPALLALLPVHDFLGGLLDRTPRAHELVSALDSAALIELFRQIDDAPAAAAIPGGLVAALLVALLLAPLLAGATVVAARSDAAPDLRGLMRGAGEYYGRLLRLAVVAVVPLGVAGGLSALAFKLARKASEQVVFEWQATRAMRLALAASALVVVLAQATLEAGRAHFAAQPERRSAFLAWWSGVRLLVRHPLRALGVYLVASASGLGLAALFMLLHLRIHQESAGAVVLAFLVAQLAVAAIAWGRASRVLGLTELVRADAEERARWKAATRAAAFEMAPPKTSPPPPSQEGKPAAAASLPAASARDDSPMEAGLVAEQALAASEPPFASPNPESPLPPARVPGAPDETGS